MAVFSASPDRRSEDIRVLSIIIAELELRNIKRHIFPADFVERADHATLEDRPEAFDDLSVATYCPLAWSTTPCGYSLPSLLSSLPDRHCGSIAPLWRLLFPDRARLPGQFQSMQSDHRVEKRAGSRNSK